MKEKILDHWQWWSLASSTVFVLGLLPTPVFAQQATTQIAEQVLNDQSQYRAMDDDDGGWTGLAGFGFRYEADYEGSKDYQVNPIPALFLEWNDTVRFSTIEGPSLSATVLRYQGFSTDFGLEYDFGRAQDDNAVLAGLGDVDGNGVFLAAFGYDVEMATGNMNFGVDIERDIGGNRKGTLVGLATTYIQPFDNGRANFEIGVEANWADSNYTSTMFGITAAQSASSALGLSTHHASAGWKDVGLTIGASYALNESFILVGEASYNKLLGDAADSPLVADYGSANQAALKLGVVYAW